MIVMPDVHPADRIRRRTRWNIVAIGLLAVDLARTMRDARATKDRELALRLAHLRERNIDEAAAADRVDALLDEINRLRRGERGEAPEPEPEPDHDDDAILE